MFTWLVTKGNNFPSLKAKSNLVHYCELSREGKSLAAFVFWSLNCNEVYSSSGKRKVTFNTIKFKSMREKETQEFLSLFFKYLLKQWNMLIVLQTF